MTAPQTAGRASRSDTNGTSATGSPPRRARRADPAGPALVLPFALLFAVFLLWPLAAGLWTSFTDRSLVGTAPEFTGLDNWAEMVADPMVWRSLWTTLLFTLMTTPPLVAVALLMAVLTQRAVRVGWFLRFSFFSPFLLPVAVVSLIWVWIYQPGFGMLNGALTGLGLSEVNWLGDEGTVLLSIAVTTVWWTVGFNYLLYLAALQGIPSQVYEAASLDGAGAWQRFRRITLPLLNRTTAIVVLLQMVASLKLFDQAYLMTNGSGGPDYAARPIIGYIFDSGFTNLRIGYSSAISYLFFAVIIAVSVLQFWLFTRKENTA
ncbi:sugar ABC transporter permease [Nocardiopsis sp. RSe5-2]|uniref:Sugar ABC transporter permease n=1 Tax=Nocardiopsis endophytica TaxID=3018445 RepID=A0ABT4UCH8_9ACTN|nr:sugar ABC transporter permease [Nocardiopsis endophytica]MDA2814666.1 sugar ABC transporter permease [Nocardiopsis endophytica]